VYVYVYVCVYVCVYVYVHVYVYVRADSTHPAPLFSSLLHSLSLPTTDPVHQATALGGPNVLGVPCASLQSRV